jgi:hypothetical protein
MTNNQGYGYIDYSFPKNSYYQIIRSNTFTFVAYYVILVILCFWFITGLRIQQYISFNQQNKPVVELLTKKYFETFTFQSPFHILSVSNLKTPLIPNSFQYIGLSQSSNLLLVCLYTLAFLVIIEYFMKNFLSAIVVSYIQENPNNNPYNNPNCVTKINESALYFRNKNYSIIISLGFVFLFPYFIPLLLRFVNIDKYDVKKSTWIQYLILFLTISPVIFIIISRIFLGFKMNPFDAIKRFVEDKDFLYVNFLKQNYGIQSFLLATFAFILIAFALMHWMYISYNVLVPNKITLTLLIMSIFFIVIPYIFLQSSLSTLFSEYQTSDDSVKQIENNGVYSLFQLIAKYNYPCFKK